MNMNAVNVGMNKYCGPAVLSILTGKSTDECARIIGSINGKYNITGVTTRDLLSAGNRLGFDFEQVEVANTLFGTLNRLAHRDGVYIVVVTGHFVTVQVNNSNIMLCDNHTKQPMPAAASARMMMKCESAYLVTKRRDPMVVSADGSIILRITEEVTYDIEKYNKTHAVGMVKFNTEADYKEFVKGLSE